MEVNRSMNHKTVLAIGLLATLLTVGLVYGLTFVSSNHLIGVSGVRPALTLTSNATGVTTYMGDTFHLVVTASSPLLDGKLVSFYDNNSGFSIGTNTIVGGATSIDYVENYATWEIHAEANY